MNGSALSPDYILRDGTRGFGVAGTDSSGSAAYFASGANLWKFEGSDVFALIINDTANDEEPLYGWMANNYIRKGNNIDRFVYNLSKNSLNGNLVTGIETDDKSFIFDGTDDYIELPNSNEIIGDNLQIVTVSAWVKYTTSSNGYILSINRSSETSSLLSLSININNSNNVAVGRIGFLTRNFADTTHSGLTDGDNYNDGQWHNVVAVVENMNRYLYVNGELKDSDTNVGMQSVTNNTKFASIGSHGGTAAFYGGHIGPINIYKKALSAEEVKRNYLSLKPKFT